MTSINLEIYYSSSALVFLQGHLLEYRAYLLILTRMGSRNEARCNDSTLELIVAENKNVRRFSLGNTLRILSRI